MTVLNKTFEELYVLSTSAEEKEKQLATLIRGSTEYYYYNTLHLLNVDPKLEKPENKTKFQALKKDWRKDWPNDYSNLNSLKLRKRLYKFDPSNPAKSLSSFFTEIKTLLGLTYSYQPTQSNPSSSKASVSTNPSKLDPALISKDAIVKPLTTASYTSIDRFSEAAYPYLANNYKLEESIMKQLLQRITVPMFDGVVDELVKHSFYDSLELHNQLTLAQMDKLQKDQSGSVNNTFIQNYLDKLLPNRDSVDWQNDKAQALSYYNASLKFVNTLPSTFNNVKLSVYYQFIKFEIAQSNYRDDLIDQYFKLPRNSHFYIYEKAVPEALIRYNRATPVSSHFKSVSATQDEALVKKCLENRFLKESDFTPYLTYFRKEFLVDIMVETKLLADDKSPETWITLQGSPSRINELKNRVDIEFLDSNPTVLHPDDKVEIKCAIKNVPHLIIKLFEINTINYYKNEKKQIDSDIKLDGLVASEEFKYDYDSPPVSRVTRTFSFPSLTGRRGVFALEFIGNGKSSRALLRKGELHFIPTTNHLGQLIKVLDEDSVKVTKASAIVDGNTYKSDENGDIQLPFTTGPSQQKPIILITESFGTLKDFVHQTEAYKLSCGIFMEPSAIIYGERAPISVRCKLFLNSVQIPVDYIEEPTLIITSTDRSEKAIQTSKEIKPFPIFDDQESVYMYKVKENLGTLQVQFQGKIRMISKGNSLETISYQTSIPLNNINASNQISEIYLKKASDGHFKLCEYGKSGEPIQHSALNIELQHWMLKDTTYVYLQTDQNGVIDLGTLDEIKTLKLYKGIQYEFDLDQYRGTYTYPATIHSKLGETITLPYFGDTKDLKSSIALFELTINQRVVRDLSQLIKLGHKELSITFPAPGQYVLHLFGQVARKISIQVCDGNIREGFIVGGSRILSYESDLVQGLHMALSSDKHNLVVSLKNHTPETRVHVCASYFLPSKSLIDVFDLINSSTSVNEITKTQTDYFSGRELGDEINYIFNRKSKGESHLPGNSLKKPSLLLQPWSVSKTSQGKESLKSGTSYDLASKYANQQMNESDYRANKLRNGRSASNDHGSFYEFLATATHLEYNLKPNEKGEVVLPLADLEASGNYISVSAVNNETILNDSLILSHPDPKFKEIKLNRALDPSQHFKEDKLISTVVEGQAFEIANVDSSKFTIYDTLEKVLSLSKTLNQSKTLLQEFSFIGNWTSLSPAQKKEKFSKYTCHELNLFIFNKDKEFFFQVVLPFIQCKMNKTFIDYYLTNATDKLREFLSNTTKFSNLNTLEKILLAKVFPDHAKSIAEHVNQFAQANPISSIMYDEYFNIALNQLDSDIDSVPDYGAVSEEEINHDDLDDYLNTQGVGGFSPPPPPQSFGAPGGMREEKKMSTMNSSSMSNTLMPMASVASAPTPIARPMVAMKMAMPVSRARVAQAIYQNIENTEELAETNYYQQLKSRASLIVSNEFWANYATHVAEKKDEKFLSKYIAFTNSNFTESVMALAVLDLPFTVKDSPATVKPKDGKLSFTANSPVIVYHQELVKAAMEKQDEGILVNQNFFDIYNRFQYENNENVEIYVRDEFLVSKVYGGKVVVANLTSRKKKLDILLQIPKGAVPVGPYPFYTQDFSRELQSYSNASFEYYFYFPTPGQYSHFPAHVSEKNQVIASVKPFVFNVVTKPTTINQMSWKYIANFGSVENILDHLEKSNLNRITFEDLYHKLLDKTTWEKVINLLKSKIFYEPVVWSFAIYHQSFEYSREYLSKRAKELKFGESIDSQILSYNPIETGDMNFFEYSPLVNARTHTLGAKNTILNHKFSQQYQDFIHLLIYKLNPTDAELISTVYYLILQDRYQDAIPLMNRVGHNQGAVQISGNLSNDNNNNISHSTQLPTSSSEKSKTLSKDDAKKLKEEAKRQKEELKRKEKEEKKKAKEEARLAKEAKKKEEKEQKKAKKEGGTSAPTSPTTSATSVPEPTSEPVSLNKEEPVDHEHDSDESDAEDDSEKVINVSTFKRPLDLNVQFDYLVSYLDFFNEYPAEAIEISKKYENYPVQRWNSMFKDMSSKLSQVVNTDSVEINYETEIDRERMLTKMVNNEPTFDVYSENSKQITVSYTNCSEIIVNYYIMDIEFLFSTNPFVQQDLGQFLYVVPNKIESHPIQSKAGTLTIDIPQEFLNKNVMIDCQSGHLHHNIIVYSNSLSVSITEKAGQLRVINKTTKKPISKAYIKVYSKNKSGSVEFYKDGYTDISGYMDYSTVSTSNISDVSKFSILILSDQFGSLIREAKPPGI